MGQGSNDAIVKDVPIVLLRVVCANDMGQWWCVRSVLRRIVLV